MSELNRYSQRFVSFYWRNVILILLDLSRIQTRIILWSILTGRLRFRYAYGYRNPRGIADQNKKLNDDCYHTTCHSAAIFGVQTVLTYIVLTLNLWLGLRPMKRSSGVWSFDEVSVTYRPSFGNHTLAGALCSGNILPEPAFSFTTVPLFYMAKLNSVPRWITAFWLIYSLDIFWYLCRHVNILNLC